MRYVIYHPGTDTFMAAEDSYLVDVDDLPADFDEWCWDAVKGKLWYQIEKGEAI